MLLLNIIEVVVKAGLIVPEENVQLTIMTL